MFENLAELIVADYQLNGRRSLDSGLNVHLKHLRAYFGFDRASDIEARHDDYKPRRREQGASVVSINRETSTLRRMFSLAVREADAFARSGFQNIGEQARAGGLCLAGGLHTAAQLFRGLLQASCRVGLSRRLEKDTDHRVAMERDRSAFAHSTAEGCR